MDVRTFRRDIYTPGVGYFGRTVLRVTGTIRTSRVSSYGIVVTTVITSELIGGVD